MSKIGWVGLLAVVLAATAFRPAASQAPGATASAAVSDATGAVIGRVTMAEAHGAVTVKSRFRTLAPGFHGFHVHTAGDCSGAGFVSAGGHLAGAGAVHGAHGGDLPPLLVTQDGRAYLRFRTDGFRLADLFDADGAAVIVHAAPDNFANIPSRYGTPDDTTIKTGDAGARVACGALTRI